MTETENPFGEPYSLGVDLLSNAFAQLELTAYLTAAEFRNLFKAFGIKRKVFSDRRRRESAKRYRERKAEKIRKKEKQSKKVSDTPLLEREQVRKAMLDMLEQKYYETHPNNFAPGKEQNSDGL